MSVEVIWNPDPLVSVIKTGTTRILKQEGARAVTRIRASFGRSRSQPGQPPGIVTGRLSRDLLFEVSNAPFPTLKLGVQANNPYAWPQELGSPSRNLRPRPFLRPQIRPTAQRVAKRVEALVND